MNYRLLRCYSPDNYEPGGFIPVDPNWSNRPIDIQTGRNVYVDPVRLQADEEYQARIQKYVDEGFYPITNDPQIAFYTLCGGQLIGPGNLDDPAPGIEGGSQSN